MDSRRHAAALRNGRCPGTLWVYSDAALLGSRAPPLLPRLDQLELFVLDEEPARAGGSGYESTHDCAGGRKRVLEYSRMRGRAEAPPAVGHPRAMRHGADWQALWCRRVMVVRAVLSRYYTGTKQVTISAWGGL